MYAGNFVPLASTKVNKVVLPKKEKKEKAETREMECQTDITAVRMSTETAMKVRSEQFVVLKETEKINQKMAEDFDDLSDLMKDITKDLNTKMPEWSSDEEWEDYLGEIIFYFDASLLKKWS